MEIINNIFSFLGGFILGMLITAITGINLVKDENKKR